MKIEVKEDIYLLMGKNSVYFKNGTFFVGEINYYSLMKIIKFINPSFYLDLIKNSEIIKYSFNSLIFDNKELKPEDIVSFILNSSIEDLILEGESYREYLLEMLNGYHFEKDKFKGLIYNSSKIDYDFLFKQFPELKILFVFDENTEEFKMIDKTGRVIQKGKIKESDIYVRFEYFKESELKEVNNNYWNKLLKDIINRLFNLELFFEEFKEEIFNRIAQILMIVDLSEENINLLKDYDEKEGFSEQISKILTAKILKKDKEMSKKYGLKI